MGSPIYLYRLRTELALDAVAQQPGMGEMDAIGSVIEGLQDGMYFPRDADEAEWLTELEGEGLFLDMSWPNLNVLPGLLTAGDANPPPRKRWRTTVGEIRGILPKTLTVVSDFSVLQHALAVHATESVAHARLYSRSPGFAWGDPTRVGLDPRDPLVWAFIGAKQVGHPDPDKTRLRYTAPYYARRVAEALEQVTLEQVSARVDRIMEANDVPRDRWHEGRYSAVRQPHVLAAFQAFWQAAVEAEETVIHWNLNVGASA